MLYDPKIRQPSFYIVEVVIVERIMRVAELKAENVRIKRLYALLPLLLPPRIVRVPTNRHGEIQALMAGGFPARRRSVGVAGPCHRVYLRIVKVSVVELVEMALVNVLV